MQKLDVHGRESGKIWHRKPSSNTGDRPLVTVTNSVSSALSVPARNVRFLHAAFDVTGDRFISADHHGHVYLFDVNRNRFSEVQKTGGPSTALAFALRRRTEFLIGMSDYSLKCYDTDAKEMVAWMKGHDSAIHSISIHASGRYALTSSNDTAQLWDLDTFQRKRKLNIKENVGIVKVFFLPLSNTIVTCFKDDSIFAWESDTLNCKYQLPQPPGKSPHFKAFAATRDGRLLVAGGRSRFLHVYALDTQRLQQVVQLPAKVTTVRQLEFLPDSFDAGANQVLGVLSQDGIMRFINIHTCKLLFDIGSLDNRITSVAVSPTGRHIVSLTDDGNMDLYCVQALTAELNKPPAPLLNVLKKDKKPTEVTKAKSQAIESSRGITLKHTAEQDVTVTGGSESILPDGLSKSRLLNILKGYGQYPEKYRSFIWRSILCLPENHAAFAALVDKGTHSSYERLHEKYPIKSRKLLRVLQRTLSALAHWSPIFGETDYLPMLAFPFVKLFQNNQLVCFEIVATVLTNWCQHWFEYFPNPPINMLGMVENVLAYHDKELLQHFVKYGVTSQIYAWPVLETLFSEVLTKDEWLQLWDNVFSNHPSFLLMVTVAYCICSRAPLLQCIELDDFQYFFHHRNAVDFRQVLKEAYRIFETTPDDLHPQKELDDFVPLTKGQYPVFNKYPKFIVDYQVQERERIRQEELEYLRQRQVSLELQKETEKKVAEEEAWYRQQQLLLEAEEKRRTVIADEEQKLADQRVRLQAMNRELKMKELQLLDAARRKFLNFQQLQKEADLKRLDDEIKQKSTLRELETQAAVEETEIRNMELQTQRKMFEQELHRDFLESQHKQKAEYDSRRKQQDLEDRVAVSLARAERDRELHVRQAMQQTLAKTGHLAADVSVRNQLEQRQRLDDLNREQQAVRLAKLQNENRDLERSIHELMGQVEDRRYQEASQGFRELEQQQTMAEEAELRRLQLLEKEVDLAQSHVSHMEQTQGQLLDQLEDLRVSIRNKDGNSQHDQFLNDTSSAESSTQFSLDRGRQTFDERERQLMTEVRELRQKLARENRYKRAPPAYNADF